MSIWKKYYISIYKYIYMIYGCLNRKMLSMNWICSVVFSWIARGKVSLGTNHALKQAFCQQNLIDQMEVCDRFKRPLLFAVFYQTRNSTQGGFPKNENITHSKICQMLPPFVRFKSDSTICQMSDKLYRML